MMYLHHPKVRFYDPTTLHCFQSVQKEMINKGNNSNCNLFGCRLRCVSQLNSSLRTITGINNTSWSLTPKAQHKNLLQPWRFQLYLKMYFSDFSDLKLSSNPIKVKFSELCWTARGLFVSQWWNVDRVHWKQLFWCLCCSCKRYLRLYTNHSQTTIAFSM